MTGTKFGASSLLIATFGPYSAGTLAQDRILFVRGADRSGGFLKAGNDTVFGDRFEED